MRAYVVGNENVVLDDDVSRQRDLVREDVVVSDDAVVSNVAADHQEVARPDTRGLVRAVMRGTVNSGRALPGRNTHRDPRTPLSGRKNWP